MSLLTTIQLWQKREKLSPQECGPYKNTKKEEFMAYTYMLKCITMTDVTIAYVIVIITAAMIFVPFFRIYLLSLFDWHCAI